MASAWDTPDSSEGRTYFGAREMSAYMAGTISFFETLIHGWDLAKATGQDTAIQIIAALVLISIFLII